MIPFVRIMLSLAALELAIGASPVPAASGIVYGSVTKFAVGQDGSAPPAPGTYKADFATAATPASTGDTPHVPFGFGKMLGKAQAAMSMLKSGTAEKHYVGISKERIDNVAQQTADITDCRARTLTHLDLAKRTYAVDSLDHPETPAATGGRHSAPGPVATDDGTKVSVSISTRGLGPMTIENVPTYGYATNITMTATKPSGESSSTSMLMTAYYSSMDEPRFGCAELHPAAAPAGGASMASMMLALQALRAPKGDARFSVTSSGPPLPTGKLAMWQDMTMNGTGRDRGGFGILTERGDVRVPLSDADPIFGIPAGFTRVDG